ncbi:hypothetical protein MD588_18235 [Photobacterium sp. SDRW27]|uniref:hypothetical protein n=1 Tax=Photobacterium obscurum TaxID=2829490 RepID=UPI00224422BD|nr:hypothetical protein [Photobacterium obscurum]MCW8330732.1 hypothetical protein [Photobacterium obscurum]
MTKEAVYIGLICSVVLLGCSSQDKQALKEGFTEIGHATRDATRATGHFFRDTTKDVINNAQAAGASAEE